MRLITFRGFLILGGALLLALGTDLASKFWAATTLAPHQPVPVLGELLRFTLAFNDGVALSIFAGTGWWPSILTSSVLAAILVWVLVARPNMWQRGAFGLLLGGGLANLIDRLPDRQVTDFIDLGLGSLRWPTFNVADLLVIIGISGLLLSLQSTHQPIPTEETF